MTRRERLERKLDKRAEWANKASARSDASFTKARTIADGIPLGQPILVGHHSERRHRRDQSRIHGAMDRGLAESKLAEHHEQKARGLAIALERTIFSDDENAIEQLEAKAKACDAAAAQCNAVNKAWRKGGRDAVAAQFSEGIAAAAAKLCAQFSWLARKGPMDASHDRAEARRCRQRIAELKRRQALTEKAEASGGVVILGESWVSVTFTEKPERSVLGALRSAGFRWGAGRWSGERSKLPPEVVELAEECASRAEERRKAEAGECLCSAVDGYLCVPCEEKQRAAGDEDDEGEPEVACAGLEVVDGG